MKISANFNRSGNSLFNAPPQLKPILNGSGASPKAFCPVCPTQSFAVVSEPAVVPFVVRLLDMGGPTAIIFRVWPVIIATVYLVLWGRSWTHIFIKALKRVAPFVGHRYPSPAIVGVVLRLWILGPFNNAAPNAIFRQVRHTVFIVASTCKFALKATAGLRIAGSRARLNDPCRIAAHAHAFPRSEASGSRGV